MRSKTVNVETDEPLETGYGPDTPLGDNVCNDFAQGFADAYLVLARARGALTRDDGPVVMTDGASPSFFCNQAVARRPMAEQGWRAAAATMAEFYGQRPGGEFLVFSPWPTPDLADLDFSLIGHPPLMLRLPAPLVTQAVDGFQIRPVEDTGSARDWEWALVHAFPISELQPFQPGCMLAGEARQAERWHHWVGYLDGEPVGTASAYLNEGHVHVEYISTVEAARGRGIGRALTTAATGLRADLPAMLIASDLGRPVYERMGYRSLLRFTLWAGHRPG